MPRSVPSSFYTLKITLLEIEPPIWRRVQVPSSIKLCCLHSAMQVVMGWTDSHLHQFEKDSKRWGIPEQDDEGKTRLANVLKSEGESMIYRYDFGDNWRHEIVLEKVLPGEGAPKRPVCLGGERRCPPEDVGGVTGYEGFLKVIFNPAHEDYERYIRWAGGHLMDQFDMQAVNDKLQRMRWPVRHKRKASFGP